MFTAAFELHRGRVVGKWPMPLVIVTINLRALRTTFEGAIEFLQKIARESSIGANEAETEVIRPLRPTSLLKRKATPEEVANLDLCGESTSATTGSALRVEGGVVRAIT
jgi:hypothetical protein